MKDQSLGINFQKTYELGEDYQSIKERASRILGEYLTGAYQGLIDFNDEAKSVTFSTEKLTPTVSTNRPRVMLLFSNPHPLSVHQGMFLSPNTKRRENSFWPVMDDAGWLPIPKEKRNPKQLADICLKAIYRGPLELLFYCYYAFPTNYPEEIKKIFGDQYFSQYIEPEAKKEFREAIQDAAVQAVVTFNKGIFNLVSENQIELYTGDLKTGKLIRSHLKGINQFITIFLTFPTGWHFHKDWQRLRVESLERIRIAIDRELDLQGSKNR
jgi:hypothetical protein